MVVAFRLPLTGYTNRFRPWRVLAVTNLCGGIGFGLLIFGGGVPLLIISVLIWSGCELVGSPGMPRPAWSAATPAPKA